MAVAQITYEEARSQMRAGDVIAFGGKGQFSEIIKFATFSSVSHVGVILQTKVTDDPTDRFFNQIIESANINGFNGVKISRMSERLDSYEGDMWWLPLSNQIRAKLDQKKFYDFLFDKAQRRVTYDLPQALTSAADVGDKLPFGLHGLGYNKEDFSKFFCSELVAAGLEISGAVDSINCSEVTPIDLCRWNIYQDMYYQLKGDTSKRIGRFNTADPREWGE